jgi:hypothetical protein
MTSFVTIDVHDLAVSLCLEYHKNKPAKPLVGKLFVYDNLVHALESVNSCLVQFEIWEAYGKNLAYANLMINPVSLSTYDATKFWNDYRDKIPMYNAHVTETPRGTMFADEVTLLKRMDEYEHTRLHFTLT